MNEDYPKTICKECAESLGYQNKKSVSCYSYDVCGWCKEIKVITEPRDYGWPPYSKNKCY